MLEIFGWIIFGAIAGWIASIIMGTNQQQGAFANIAVGIIGAMIGGFIMRSLGTDVSGFNVLNLLVAVFGAMLLIALLRMVSGNHAKPKI